MKEVCIVAAKRTPIGSFMGTLSSYTAPALGAMAIRAALHSSQVDQRHIGQVIMGNVLTAGVGQAPARQAMRAAGLADAVGALTVNKVCGSGMMAVQLGAMMVRTGEMAACVVGGMESMSNAPYLLPNARAGLRLGNANLVDAMIHDGLWDPYHNYHMGSAAELCSRHHKISREDQDRFAVQSYERARQAQAAQHFANEMVSVEIKGKKGEVTVINADEEPSRFFPEKFPTLKPAFEEGGTVTAANASSINDGAAALILATPEVAAKSEVLATIRGFSNAALAPEWFTVAPVQAIRQLLEKCKLSINDIDLFEINEAFAVVALAAQRELKLDPARLNVHGGAVGLGHPIGASGARILVTLIHALRQRKLRRGVAAICLGGGEAIAMLVEI